MIDLRGELRVIELFIIQFFFGNDFTVVVLFALQLANSIIHACADASKVIQDKQFVSKSYLIYSPFIRTVFVTIF